MRAQFTKLGYQLDSDVAAVPASFGMRICIRSQLHPRQPGNRLKNAFFSTIRFSICDCATKRDQMATKLGNQLEQYVLSMFG